jgi:hypothetical protein
VSWKSNFKPGEVYELKGVRFTLDHIGHRSLILKYRIESNANTDLHPDRDSNVDNDLAGYRGNQGLLPTKTKENKS